MEAHKCKVLLCSTGMQFLSEFRPLLTQKFDVQCSTSGDMSLFLAKEWEPQICLIDGDVQMPKIVSQLRQKYTFSHLGILVLTKNTIRQNEEAAFLAGADHYLQITDNFNPVILRMKSLIKRLLMPQEPSQTTNILKVRQAGSGPNWILFGALKVFPQDFLIKKDNLIINTTPTQFKLLLAFVSNKEQLLSRAWIKEVVWENASISPRSIDAQISKLKKLIPDLDQCLVNIYGKGYILTDPDKKAA